MFKAIVSKFNSNQAGQAFPMALIVLAMGSLFVGGFLTAVNTNFLIADVYSDPIPDNYTADAGIEDAIWGLQYGTLADTVSAQGGQYTYTLPNQVNGTTAEITVARTGDGTIAYHDFEAHSWKGGTGWLSFWLWDDNRYIDIKDKDDPYEGRYYAQITGPNVNLRRSVNLTGYSSAYLDFWAKAKLFEPGDTVYLQVSTDGIIWHTLQPWTVIDSDDTYKYYSFDLTPFTLSGEFWIGFESTLAENGKKDEDYFLFDAIRVYSDQAGYTIVSIAGERTTTVTLDITGGVTTINSWEIE